MIALLLNLVSTTGITGSTSVVLAALYYYTTSFAICMMCSVIVAGITMNDRNLFYREPAGKSRDSLSGISYQLINDFSTH
ncbi:MAG: hypothetical protein ACSLEM_02965 [Candidatus Malihini olakiniferum]